MRKLSLCGSGRVLFAGLLAGSLLSWGRVAAAPDLDLPSVNYTGGTYSPGATINATGTERNRGDDIAYPDFWIEAHLSSDRVWGNADDVRILRIVEDEGLWPSESFTAPVVFVIPANTPGGQYYVVGMIDADHDVAESNEANNWWWSTTRNITIAASPPPPTGVAASDGTYTDKVRVTWNASAGATSYEVWRATQNNSGAATRIATSVAATTYDDTSAATGTTYYYWVKAKNAHGTSAFSSPGDSGFRAAAGPAPPTGVAASDGTYTDRVRVTWNTSAGATSYEVWRAPSNNVSAATRIAESVSGTSYDDTTAWPGDVYWYWVKARNSQGTSGWSAPGSGYRARPLVVCVDDSNTTGTQDGTAQHPFSAIQAGIDIAANGGTIKVARGTYEWSLDISRTVTIQGGYPGLASYPPDFTNFDPNPATNHTVIDGRGSGALIDASDPGSTLASFTVRNGGGRFWGMILRRVIATSD